MSGFDKKAWTVAGALVLACIDAGAQADDAASAPSVASAASAPAVLVAASAPGGVYAQTQQPRSFGHVVGDVLTQRVLLERAGHTVAPAALPAADRVGLFLERRAPHVEQDELGHRWLVIDYQVINAPRALIATSLPALSIGVSGALPLNVASWPISIGPLTPPAAFGQGELLPLRPDRAVEPLPTARTERQLKASLVALVAVLLAWAAWWSWRNWREAQRLPFARAWQRLRRLDPDSPEAWLALHHALNAAAGRAVHGATLPRLMADAPHFQPLQPRLEAFFNRSAERFFAGTPAMSTTAPFPLRELGRALREAERRQHR